MSTAATAGDTSAVVKKKIHTIKRSADALTETDIIYQSILFGATRVNVTKMQQKQSSYNSLYLSEFICHNKKYRCNILYMITGEQCFKYSFLVLKQKTACTST